MTRVQFWGDLAGTGFGTVTKDLGRALLDGACDLALVDEARDLAVAEELEEGPALEGGLSHGAPPGGAR